MSTFNAGAPFAPETSGQDGDKENSSKSKKAHDAWREQYEQKQEAKAHSLISSQIAKDEQKDKQEKAQKAEKKESLKNISFKGMYFRKDIGKLYN